MNRKLESGILLLLLLISMSTFAFDIQRVEASGTIYIRADGSIDPPTANITSTDNITYTFNDNNYDQIYVERSNIIVDGNGFKLDTEEIEGGHGFRLDGISNVTIRNTNIEAHYGIWLISSSNTTFSGNNLTTTGWGIMVSHSSNNEIFGNNITIYHNWGVELWSSQNNVLRNNTIAGTLYTFRVRGSELSHFIQDVDESNTVNSRPIYYLVNRRDMEVPFDAGYVALVNSTNMFVEGLELKGNGEGILLAYTANSQVTNNTITDNYESACLYASSNNTFSGNNITHNLGDVYLRSSSNNNTFSGNIIADALGGVSLYDSSNNKFSGNDIRNNTFSNVYLHESSNNVISGNTITNSTGSEIGEPGRGVAFYMSSNNVVSGNNITDNSYGVKLYESSNNDFYHNNLIDNTHQVYIDASGYANSWDDGYPSGGNYWSDYAGVDVKHGSGQDQPGSDGIGDTPYVMDGDNIDNYPLRNPTYGPPSPQTYRLKITTTIGGTTNPSTGTHTYEEGTVVSVTAINHTNYRFHHWVLDDPWNYSNPINITMDSDHALHAVFSYDVKIDAYCYNNHDGLHVSIDMDGLPTGYQTPHTFTNLTSTHNFTVPETDPHDHPFKQWSTGETSTTLSVDSSGTYTAYYYYEPVTNVDDPFPHIARIQYKVYDTTEQMNDALLIANEIDMRPGPGTMTPIEACIAAGYNMTIDPMAAFGFMALQNRDEYCAHVSGGPAGKTPGDTAKPLNDSRFRVALSYIWGMDDKADHIYEYYGNELTVALGSMQPYAMGGWVNPSCIMPDTDDATAWSILYDAGYRVGTGDDAGYLLNPDGSRVRDLEVVYPTGWLSWQYILQQFVGQVNAFFDEYVGVPNGPNFILTDREYVTLLYELMVYHDFDLLAFDMTRLGATPDWCFDIYHSSTIGPGQWNFGGFVNDTMDDLLETMMYSMDENEVRDAVWQMGCLFVSDWMPLFPVTTGQGITTWHPDIDNFIGSPGPGADQNYLSWRSVHWGPDTVYNDPPYAGLIRRGLESEPDTLSPWNENTESGWLILDGLCEPLMMPSPPHPSVDMPWIAYRSEVEPVNSLVNAEASVALGIPDGMKVTYYLRNDVYWQDTGAGGKTFQLTADDCQFALNMLKKWQVNRYQCAWSDVLYMEAEGPYEFVTYFNATGLWFEDYPQIASFFPKHIYYILDEMAEQTPGTYDDKKLVWDSFIPDAWDYQDWTVKAIELNYTSTRPRYKDYYATWPDGGLPPRDSNAPQTANVGAGPFVYDYYYDDTRIGEVHSNDVYWVDGPIKAVVDAPYVAFVSESDCVEDPVQYNVLVTNYGYKVDGELANKTVDVVIKEDGIVKHVENDTQVNVFDWTTLGPYTIYPLCAGTVDITVEVWQEVWQDMLLVDTYTHTIHASIPEDINIDDKVRVDDVLATALAFGSDPLVAFLRWDPRVDVNGDFKVRVDDILAVALKFGWP